MRSFIFFILGATAGAVGGAFAMKYICEAKADKKIADATAEARNFYKDKYEKESADLDKKVDNEAHKKLAEVYQQPSDRIFGRTYDVPESTYVSYREQPRDEKGNKTYIYMIDPDDAGMDDSFTQYCLDYYQDGSLVDEQGNLVDEPMEIAGEYLDELSLENPEIHVRNDVTKTEYDICYIAASYEQPGGVYD